MSAIIYLNGELLRPEDGRISPFDRGFLFGDGLFETIRVYEGRGHLLGRHLRRLAAGAGYLGISLPPVEELADAVRRTIAVNAAREAVLRLTVTRGEGDLVLDMTETAPTILITLRPLLQNDGGMITDARVDGSDGRTTTDARVDGGDGRTTTDARVDGGDGRTTTDARVDGSDGRTTTEADDTAVVGRPAAAGDDAPEAERIIPLRARHAMPEIGRRVKSLNYMTAAYSARELAEAGVREGILLSADGFVAEGTVSNIFRVREGVLQTPPLSMGVLDGVTRGRVIELARERGIDVREWMFDLEDLCHSDECFYTNSVREIVPVGIVFNARIGDGRAGPMASMLRAAYRAEAPSEEVDSR